MTIIMANRKVTVIKAIWRLDREARELGFEINKGKDAQLIIQNHKMKSLSLNNYLGIIVIIERERREWKKKYKRKIKLMEETYTYYKAISLGEWQRRIYTEFW